MLTQKRYIISHTIDQPFLFSFFLFPSQPTHQRRSGPWSLSLTPCCLTWTRSSCCCGLRWWRPASPRRRTSREALSRNSTRCAPPRSRIYTPDGKNTRHIDVTVGHEICSFCTNSRHFLRSQTYRTPGWCGTGWAPPAATRSSCLVGTPWASLGWWGNRSARWWSHRRQLLVGESSDFSGTSVKDKTLATHKLHRKPWVNYLALYFFLCWLKKKSSETEVVEF